jgi:hypothetical protein
MRGEGPQGVEPTLLGTSRCYLTRSRVAVTRNSTNIKILLPLIAEPSYLFLCEDIRLGQVQLGLDGPEMTMIFWHSM